MAGFFGTFIIEWECLRPEIHHDTHGFLEIVGNSATDASEKFLAQNPDYAVLSVKSSDVPV